MREIQIIPVIEVKDGRAIEAVKGKTVEYRELRSSTAGSSDPLDIAASLERIGFGEIFILDLDGIVDDRPNYEMLSTISQKTCLLVMADIGAWTLEDMLNLDRIKPVISTETFSSLNTLSFPRDFVLSLETRDEELLSAMNLPLKEFIRIIKDSTKIREILLVNRTRISTSMGPDIDLCSFVAKELSDRILMYGGGVRNMDDVHKLYDAGIQKVLVGSAIHSGALLKELFSGLAKPQVIIGNQQEYGNRE